MLCRFIRAACACGGLTVTIHNRFLDSPRTNRLASTGASPSGRALPLAGHNLIERGQIGAGFARNDGAKAISFTAPCFVQDDKVIAA